MGLISKGNKMMVLWDNKPIALSTNHTVSINPNVLTDRTKDDGDAPVGNVDGYTWAMTSDSVLGVNDLSVSDGERSITALISRMIEKSAVAVVTDAVTPLVGSVPGSGWKATQNNSKFPYMSGAAHIESISVSAGSTGYATASVSFKGKGKLS